MECVPWSSVEEGLYKSWSELPSPVHAGKLPPAPGALSADGVVFSPRYRAGNITAWEMKGVSSEQLGEVLSSYHSKKRGLGPTPLWAVNPVLHAI